MNTNTNTNTNISVCELAQFIVSSDWDRKKELTAIDRRIVADDGSLFTVGAIQVTSVCGGVKITYDEGFNFANKNVQDFSADCEGLDDNGFVIEGLSVFDEDGIELTTLEISEYLPAEFSAVDYKELIPELSDTAEVVDDDATGDRAHKFFLVNDAGRDVEFYGELVAHVCNQAHNSAHQNEWSTIEIYKTRSGKTIANVIDESIVGAYSSTSRVHVCESESDCVAAVGCSGLAKEAYDMSGIQHTVFAD